VIAVFYAAQGPQPRNDSQPQSGCYLDYLSLLDIR